MIELIVDSLTKAQNSDGGWGAGRAKASNTEVTSLAVLSLSTVGTPSLKRNVERGLTWLIDRQGENGSFLLSTSVKESSWTTALATVCLSQFKSHRQKAILGANWLLGQEGRRLGWLGSLFYHLAPEKRNVQLNPDLKGWPWTSGSFSWVEPTAYALIALKKLKTYLGRNLVEKRIEQGELMIYDRMCKEGGWNYGNSTVFGENLWPYPDITALTLIALQDHQTEEANELSIQSLRKMLAQNDSGLSLSWSILCFSLYGYDTSEWKTLLARSYEKRGFLGETKSIALALLALGKGAEVFRV